MLAVIAGFLLALSAQGATGYLPGARTLGEAIASLAPAPPADSASGATIQWDQSTLRRLSHPKYGSAGYPRLVQLKDDSLLCVYDADSSIVAAKSTDLGATWTDPVPVAARTTDVAMAAPDLIQLLDGSILVGYNGRPENTSAPRAFTIHTCKSYDGGLTFTDHRILYRAGEKFDEGCWEPAPIQLPSGLIQLYFANEHNFRHCGDQEISMVTSADAGLSWTTQPQVVSYKPFARDGMPSPLVLAGGCEIVCAIEDLGWWGSFKPTIIRTSITDPWPAPVGPFSLQRERPLLSPLPLEVYAGAPTIRQLKSGHTLLAYQGTEDRRRNHLYHAQLQVLVGDATARHFGGKTAPFSIPTGKYGLWNSLAVLSDDTVIALTSTNAFSKKQQVWMIKGRLITPR